MNQAFIEQVEQIAIRAGHIAMRYYKSQDLTVELKADESPITQADLAVNEYLLSELNKLAPEIEIISEEQHQQVSADIDSQHLSWLIDPIDGTKEFIAQTDEFTVNIALVKGTKVQYGWVVAPAINESFHGGQGLGSFKNKQTIKVDDPNARLICLGSRQTPWRGRWFDIFSQHFEKVELAAAGSSLKFCRIAEGEAHFYARNHAISEWDTAAAQAVLEGAGGQVVNWQGQSLSYHKPSLISEAFIASCNGNLVELLV